MQGDVVVITGAGSGIGRATARAFGREGATVIATDRDVESAHQTAEVVAADGGRCEPGRLDVTDSEMWEEFSDDLCGRRGVPRVVVNNAGYTTAGRFVDHTAEDWAGLVAVNIRGVVTGSRVFARRMVDAGTRGQIVNVASAAAYTPILLSSPYCTTKAAVLMFSESLRMELKPHGIGVTAICPGAINTGFYREAQHLGVDAAEREYRRSMSIGAISRFGSGPDAVAKVIVRSVRTNRAVQPVTAEAYLGYGVSRLSPTAMKAFARVSSGDFLSRLGHAALPGFVARWVQGVSA